MSVRCAAFIDRDGVINEDLGFVGRIKDFFLLPGAVDGLRILQSAGFRLVVVTNQSGIARGLFTRRDYELLTSHMRRTLAKQGVKLDGVYHCPHHPDEGIGALRVECDCRKPRPGLLLRARRELDLDLTGSVMIGDKASDIAAGRAAGVGSCVLVHRDAELSRTHAVSADACAPDLTQAARWIVSRIER
jgi:D-glycero-D-manno-heptose 1,7-bisphosphate phosphatase